MVNKPKNKLNKKYKKQNKLRKNKLKKDQPTLTELRKFARKNRYEFGGFRYLNQLEPAIRLAHGKSQKELKLMYKINQDKMRKRQKRMKTYKELSKYGQYAERSENILIAQDIKKEYKKEHEYKYKRS